MWVCGWVVISMTFTSWQVHSLVGRVTSVFYVVYTNWSVKFACRLPCCFYPCLAIRNSKHKNEGFNMAKFVPQSMFLFFLGLQPIASPASRGGTTAAANTSGVLTGSAAVPSKYGWTAEPFGSWQGEKFGDARSPPWKLEAPIFPLEGWFMVRKFRRSKQISLKFWQFSSKQLCFLFFHSF